VFLYIGRQIRVKLNFICTDETVQKGKGRHLSTFYVFDNESKFFLKAFVESWTQNGVVQKPYRLLFKLTETAKYICQVGQPGKTQFISEEIAQV
jgi:hypothetical protein